MPGRILTDNVVEVIRDFEHRLDSLESSGWTLFPGGSLTVTDSSNRTRIILGLMSDGTTGIRIYDSSGTLQVDNTYS